MSERSSPSWPAWVAAGIFVAIIVVAILIVRRGEPPPDEASPSVPEKTAAVPAPAPALTRADLIEAAARAADAFALGRPPPAENSELVGRRFTLRLPFGCSGPTSDDGEASASWSYDPEEETLRARVRSEVWTDADFMRAIAGGAEFEAAEGFWISRPWIRVGDCPRRSTESAERETADPGEASPPPEEPERSRDDAGNPETAPARETLGLVELFEPGSRRAARRNGRPYEMVRKAAPGEIDLDRGLRLVVEGRLAALVHDQPIACRAARPEERPLCLVGARLDRVAITDASGRQVLAEWVD